MLTKRKINTLYFTFLGIAVFGLFLPLLILIIKNWNIYFYQKEGLSVAFGGVVALTGIVLLMKFGFKKFNSIFWATLLLVSVYCFNSIITDTLPIVFMIWIGVVWFTIWSIPMKHYKELKDAYKNEEVRTISREVTKEKVSKLKSNGRC